MHDALVRSAADRFRSLTGAEPEAAALAPGRVNLIGEHTDYNGGFVMPLAIDRACVAAGGRSSRKVSRVHSAAARPAEASFEFDAATVSPGDLPPGSWVRYAVGVVAGFRDAVGAADFPPVEIAIASDVPLGGGLASSAAVEVAVAALLGSVLGIRSSPLDTARLCQRAEHEWAGTPCGLMDQLASICGMDGHALLIDCRSLEITPVALPREEDASVVVADTTVRHVLASGEYARRRASCAAAAAALGVASLRDADERLLASAGSALTDERLRCARHVVTENGRVRVFAERLRSGDLAGAGEAMNRSHASLRDDFRVSCPELDALAETARETPGVYGSRMTGGGFGGCIVSLCAPHAVGRLAGVLTEALRRRHGRTPLVYPVRASAGARLVPI